MGKLYDLAYIAYLEYMGFPFMNTPFLFYSPCLLFHRYFYQEKKTKMNKTTLFFLSWNPHGRRLSSIQTSILFTFNLYRLQAVGYIWLTFYFFIRKSPPARSAQISLTSSLSCSLTHTLSLTSPPTISPSQQRRTWQDGITWIFPWYEVELWNLDTLAILANSPWPGIWNHSRMDEHEWVNAVSHY